MIHDHGERPDDWVGDWSGRRATLSPDAVGLRDRTTAEEYTYDDLDAREPGRATARGARSSDYV